LRLKLRAWLKPPPAVRPLLLPLLQPLLLAGPGDAHPPLRLSARECAAPPSPSLSAPASLPPLLLPCASQLPTPWAASD
jgi:hypothetical protein